MEKRAFLINFLSDRYAETVKYCTVVHCKGLNDLLNFYCCRLFERFRLAHSMSKYYIKRRKKQMPNLIVIFISSLIAVLIVRAFEIAIKKIIRAVKNGKNES